MKRQSASPKVPYYWDLSIRLFNVISGTHVGGKGLTPLQKSSRCILQPQPTGQVYNWFEFGVFLYLDCGHTKVKEPSLPYYLPEMNSWIPIFTLPSLLTVSEMQIASLFIQRPTSVRMWHKAVLRWVLSQGRSPTRQAVPKMPRTPSAFPFSGRLRRRAINPTPLKRVKAWGGRPPEARGDVSSGGTHPNELCGT